MQGSYDEYLSYDSNGNILTLQRYGEVEDATMTMLIDDLKYGYDIGNKLLNVTDEEAHPSGFNDGNKHTQTNLPDFVYDAAGNLTRDRNKKISAITYNHLNQPKKLTSDTGEITYLYDAEGNKVQKQVTENRQTQITDYLGGFQYLSGKLDFLPHAEGYVKAVHTGSATEYHYVYHYTDHLGNIRLSYGRDPETNEIAILKESHYYPFGLTHKGYVGNHRVFEPTPGGRVNLIPVHNYLDDSYRYTFGGKEEQPELGLNWIDHHARNYMPDLGRWMSPDPLSEEYSSWSPYNYAMNNPLRFVDPTGMASEDIIIKGSKKFINQAFANLQSLTDDTLAIDENGKVIISNSSCNSVCQVGGNLVFSLINNEDSTVTIVETSGGNKTKGGTKSEANLQNDGSPGSGAKEIIIEFNPNKTTGGVDVNGSKERPTEIGLGHELIHAKNRVKGKRATGDSGVRDPDRQKGQGTILSNEELNTRKAENELRKERNVPLRKTKQ